MPVKEADPGAQELTAAFGAAMGATPAPREPDAPPEIDPEAPHGRDEAGEPLAPYGHTKDGRVRKSAAGRRARDADDKPRTGNVVPPATGGTPAAAGAEVAEHDYRPSLTELGDAGWIALSAIGIAGPAIPIVGKWIPTDKISAQAALLRFHKDNLVGAINIAAQHNGRAAAWAAKIESGQATWVIMAGFMIMPFVTHSAALWKGAEAMAEAGLPAAAELAQINAANVAAYMQEMTSSVAEAEAAAAEEMQQAAAAAAEPAGV